MQVIHSVLVAFEITVAVAAKGGVRHIIGEPAAVIPAERSHARSACQQHTVLTNIPGGKPGDQLHAIYDPYWE